MSMWSLAALNAGLVTIMMIAAWGLSLRLRDTSVVDSFWGGGFALIAVASSLASEGFPRRQALVAGLALVWGLRLTTHITLRNRGKGEDRRYRAMREAHGEGWAARSLVTVFLLQGGLMLAISAPLQLAAASPLPARLTLLDLLGAGLWTAGFLIETVADAQLARFKQDPANAGKVMDQGLWRYSRHPNYFGDAVVWWGFWCIALSVPGGAWTLPAPVVMTWLLRRVSGVPLLEQDMAERRPGYVDYVRRTSPFIPRRPGPGVGG